MGPAARDARRRRDPARFPTLHPGRGRIALYETAKAGFARPELTVHAHLELAEKRGAALHFGEPVLEWAATAGGGVAGADRGAALTPPGSW